MSTSTDPVRQRMAAANPARTEAEPPREVMTAAVLLDMIDDRSGAMAHKGDSQGQETSVVTRSSRPNWVAAFAAGFAVVLIVGISIVLMSRGGDSLDLVAPSTTVVTTMPATTIPTVSASSIDRVNRVRSLAVATDGSLWIATADGVVRWNLSTQTSTIYRTDDGLPAGGVGFVEAGPDGTVLAGGDGWMARFDGSWVTFPVPGESPLPPTAIGPDGSVWSVLGEREVGRFDGSEWQVLDAPYLDVEGPWVSSLAVALDGTLWVGITSPSSEDPELSTVSGGVASFDGVDWTRYTTADGLPDRVGNSVTVAPDGTVWAGSAGFSWTDGSGGGSIPGGGAARFDGTTWTGFTTTDGLPSNDVEISVGVDGSVWAVSIVGDGVARFDGAGWTLFSEVRGVGGSVDATGTLWLPAADPGGGTIGFDGVDIIHLAVPVDDLTTTAVLMTTVVPSSGDWNPILAETQARAVSPAATCPEGTNSDTPGSAGQDQPEAGWVGVQAGAFDSHTGRILYIDALHETWTFDVCTNTWHEMNPTGAARGDFSGGLVYDADSDVTVAFGHGSVYVYDAGTNAWTYSGGAGSDSDRFPPLGGVYDPISGLIVTTHLSDDYLDTWAYDVDTNTWTMIGRLWERQGEDYTWFELLGYSREIDRLIFGSVNDITALVDPRTGETTLITTPTPAVSFGWPKAQYGPAGDTTYVAEGVWVDGGSFDTQFPDEICGFDPDTSAWTSCFAMPGGSRYQALGAMVDDPINNRLVLIHGVYGSFWANADGNVWAIDIDTGELTQLLAPPGE